MVKEGFMKEAGGGILKSCAENFGNAQIQIECLREVTNFQKLDLTDIIIFLSKIALQATIQRFVVS